MPVEAVCRKLSGVLFAALEAQRRLWAAVNSVNVSRHAICVVRSLSTLNVALDPPDDQYMAYD